MTDTARTALISALDGLESDDFLAVLDGLRVCLPWQRFEDEDLYELKNRGGRVLATVWKAKDKGWHVTGKTDEGFLCWHESLHGAKAEAEKELREAGYVLAPPRKRPNLHVVGGAFGHAPKPQFKEV